MGKQDEKRKATVDPSLSVFASLFARWAEWLEELNEPTRFYSEDFLKCQNSTHVSRVESVL